MRQILYGINHGRTFVFQFWYDKINLITFRNWNADLLDDTDKEHLVAIWHFKERKQLA